MGKWFGKIGYSTTAETTPGVWTETVVERDYYGDLIRINRQLTSNGNVQEMLGDDLNLSNELSIVADPFAYENSAFMKYAVIMGARWKIKTIEVRYPRLILHLGGVYHGPTPETPEDP